MPIGYSPVGDEQERADRVDPARQLAAVLASLATEVGLAARPAVAEVQRRLRQDRLRILVGGEFNRGKSTLINAIVGRDVLPSGLLPLTSVPTVVRGASADEPPDTCLITFFDRSVERHPIEAVGAFATEEANPGNERRVAAVEVVLAERYVPAGVELVDLPGTGSLQTHNTAAAASTLDTADAAIFVTASDPPLSATEADLLADLAAQASRLAVVLNKIDRVPSDELERVLAYVRTAAARRLGDDVPVLPVSAILATNAARLAPSAAPPSRSGLAAVRAWLGELWGAGRRSALLVSLTGRAAGLAADERHAAELALAASRLSAQQVAARVGGLRRELAPLREAARDSRAVLVGRLADLQAATDQQARERAAALAGELSGSLDELIEQARVGATGVDDTPYGDVEARVVAELERRTLAAAETWRAHRAGELDTAVTTLADELAERATRHLEPARELVAQTFDVPAVRRSAPLGFAAPVGFFYAPSAPAGQLEVLAAAARRRLPGGLAIRAAHRRLHDLAADLPDKHHGRVRADLQYRLDQTRRALIGQLDAAYAEVESTLAALVTRAEHLDEVTQLERETEQATLRRAVQRLGALGHQLETLHHHLNETVTTR